MGYKKKGKIFSNRTRYLIGLVVILVIFIWWRTDISIDAWKAGEELKPVTLVRVVDGDTIVVNKDGKEVKVRFIGVDAAESVHSDESLNTEEGVAASEYLKSIISAGDRLYIQTDMEEYDVYDRVLAYVWISNDVDVESETDIEKYMLNGIMVSEGYAVAKRYPPNVRYAKVFEKLEMKR